MGEDTFNLLVLRICRSKIAVAEHDGQSDSFQVKFPNVFMNNMNGGLRVEDQRFKDWDHYKFTLWQ